MCQQDEEEAGPDPSVEAAAPPTAREQFRSFLCSGGVKAACG